MAYTEQEKRYLIRTIVEMASFGDKGAQKLIDEIEEEANKIKIEKVG